MFSENINQSFMDQRRRCTMTTGANIEEARIILDNAKKAQDLYFNAIIQLIERLQEKQ